MLADADVVELDFPDLHVVGGDGDAAELLSSAAACLLAVSHYFGSEALDTTALKRLLAHECEHGCDPVPDADAIIAAARDLGLHATASRLTPDDLESRIATGKPVMADIGADYVVVLGVSVAGLLVVDPTHGTGIIPLADWPGQGIVLDAPQAERVVKSLTWESPQPHAALARGYADSWNLLHEQGQRVPQAELHAASEELGKGDWRVHCDAEGMWSARHAEDVTGRTSAPWLTKTYRSAQTKAAKWNAGGGAKQPAASSGGGAGATSSGSEGAGNTPTSGANASEGGAKPESSAAKQTGKRSGEFKDKLGRRYCLEEGRRTRCAPKQEAANPREPAAGGSAEKPRGGRNEASGAASGEKPARQPKQAKPPRPSVDDMATALHQARTNGVKPEDLESTAKLLATMTVKDITEVKRKLGLKASGAKAQMVEKILRQVGAQSKAEQPKQEQPEEKDEPRQRFERNDESAKPEGPESQPKQPEEEPPKSEREEEKTPEPEREPEADAKTPDRAAIQEAGREVLRKIKSAPVHDIAELRAQMPRQLQGQAFDQALLQLADDGKVMLSQDALPESHSEERKRQLLRDGNAVFTTVSPHPDADDRPAALASKEPTERSPAPQEETAEKATPRLSDHVDRALESADLTDARKQEYRGYMDRATARMPRGARQRLARNLKGLHFSASMRDIAGSIVDDLERERKANPEALRETVLDWQRGHLGEDGQRRFDQRMRDPAERTKTADALVNKTLDELRAFQGRNGLAGCFNSLVSKTFLAGKPDVAVRSHQGVHHLHEGTPEQVAVGIYAHELTHTLDGKYHELSSSPRWKDIFDREIVANGGHRINEYASQNVREGFAEFGRLVYSGQVELKTVQTRFPAATRYFKELGLWPENPT